jgi:hypothetical protein
MKMLSADELAELRADVASFGYSQNDLDDLIRLVDGIVISFIDQEFGWSPVQTSLSARANRAFSVQDSCSGVLPSGTFGQVDALGNGVAKPERSADQFAP